MRQGIAILLCIGWMMMGMRVVQARCEYGSLGYCDSVGNCETWEHCVANCCVGEAGGGYGNFI